MRYFVIAVMALMIAAPAAWCADQPNVTVQLTAQRVVKKGQGQEVLSPGDTAKPGEVIEYRVVYRNSGKGTARDLQGRLPIPAEMEYVPGSAVPADVSASLDDKNFSKVPLKHKVRLPDGSIAVREVPSSEYRSLRWDLRDLAPGASVTAKARMRIRTDLGGPAVIRLDSKKK
jgi:uncharacterized repeat protein (TIGR01451 family)